MDFSFSKKQNKHTNKMEGGKTNTKYIYCKKKRQMAIKNNIGQFLPDGERIRGKLIGRGRGGDGTGVENSNSCGNSILKP